MSGIIEGLGESVRPISGGFEVAKRSCFPAERWDLRQMCCCLTASQCCVCMTFVTLSRSPWTKSLVCRALRYSQFSYKALVYSLLHSKDIAKRTQVHAHGIVRSHPFGVFITATSSATKTAYKFYHTKFSEREHVHIENNSEDLPPGKQSLDLSPSTACYQADF